MRARPRQIRLRLNPDNPIHLPVYQWVRQLEKKGGRIVQAHVLAILAQHIAAQAGGVAASGVVGTGSGTGSTGGTGRRVAPPAAPVAVVQPDQFMGVPVEHEPVITVLGDEDDSAVLEQDDHGFEIQALPVSDLIEREFSSRNAPSTPIPALPAYGPEDMASSLDIEVVTPPVSPAEQSGFRPKTSRAAQLHGGFGGMDDGF